MKRLFPLFLVGLFLFITSCESGPKLIPVKGRVTFDGVPVASGLVHFEGADGKSPSSKGGAITNGEYTAEVPVGELIVKITGSKSAGTYTVYEGVPDSPVKEKFIQFIPAAFNTDTKLKVTVTAKKDDLNFDLKSP